MAAQSLALPSPFILPALEFQDTRSGLTYSASELMGPKGLVIGQICNHCPYVLHIAPRLSACIPRIQELGFGIVLLSSNDPVHYPQDAPERMPEWAIQFKMNVVYAFDADQTLAKALYSSCTPEFSVFSVQGACTYRGRFDESHHKNGLPSTGADLMGALETLALGKNPNRHWIPSTGCSIKWKPGNEPDYLIQG